MNTQTHMLMAVAVLLPAASTLARRGQTPKKTAQLAREPMLTGAQITVAALVGALLPDASLFIMFIIAKAQGVADSVIWGEWYFSTTWQRFGALSNSIPIFASVAIIAYWLRVHAFTIGALAALMHCFADLPLHHDDGHPHFWPFSDWIYSSPVSYWDPAHYGNHWSVIELCLAAAMVVFLWLRSTRKISRALLVLAALSYAVVAIFWLTAFG